MGLTNLFTSAGADAALLQRATVVDVQGDVALVLPDGASTPVACERLWTSDHPVTLSPGDIVLISHSESPDEAGIVLGRIGPSSAQRAAAADTPDELVLEARHCVTLKCGDGSITIREDGKVLIKGKDLVSHASRMNRIRGGAVAIN